MTDDVDRISSTRPGTCKVCGCAVATGERPPCMGFGGPWPDCPHAVVAGRRLETGGAAQTDKPA